MPELTDKQVRALSDVLRGLGYSGLTDEYTRQQAEKLMRGGPADSVFAQRLKEPMRDLGLLPVVQGEGG